MQFAVRIALGYAATVLAFAPLNAFAQGPLPGEVAATKLGHGWRLTDPKGMTLYVSDADERGSGKSSCSGECADVHAPVLAPADAVPPSKDWATIDRASGVRQWTFRGKPLHAFARDAFPGAVFGEGDGWSAAFRPIDMPPGVSTQRTLLGQVLATATGLTLYTTAQTCTGTCLDTWTPVIAPRLARPPGDFTPANCADGDVQWSFQGKALYAHARDAKPGDTYGNGGGWNAVVLEPPPPVPGWVTVAMSDGGELLADPNGMTLYAYDEARNHLVYVRGEDCFGPCIVESWAPVAADATAPPIGDWSVITAEDGALQWAYKGQPLYISKRETRRGDLNGIALRRHRAWRPIMRAMPSLQGASPNG